MSVPDAMGAMKGGEEGLEWEYKNICSVCFGMATSHQSLSLPRPKRVSVTRG